MGRFFSLLAVYVVALTAPNVFAASRSKMSGVENDASDITWAHAVNSRDALDKALQGPVDFLEADISLGHVVDSDNYPQIPIMAHPPDTTSDISLDTWLNIVVTKRPDKGLKLDFKSLEVLEPSLIVLKKYSSKLNGSLWLSADVLSGPVLPKTTPLRSDYFLAMCSRFFPDATIALGWTTYWIKRFPINKWQYEWKHVRQMADTVRCWYNNRKYPPLSFSVRAMFAARSIKQLQWLLSTIPHSSLTVWSATGDNVNSEDFLRIQKSFPVEKVYFEVPVSLYKPSTKFKANNVKKEIEKYIPRWISVTRKRDKTCEAFTYTDSSFILFGRPSNSAVLQQTLIPVGVKSNFTITGRLKFFPGEDSINPSHWEHRLKLVLSNINRLPKNAIMYSKKKRIFQVRDPDVLWSAVNSSVLYTFEHQYFQENTACRMFKLDINSNMLFDAWTIPCDSSYEDYSYEKVTKGSILEVSLEERLDNEEGMLMVGFHSYGEEYVLIYDIDVINKEEAIKPSMDFPQLKLAFVSSNSKLGENFNLIIELILVVLCSRRYLFFRT